MLYEVIGKAKELNLFATGVDEILQNIAIIITTPKGSVPLDRNFGIDTTALDLPLEIAENIFTSQVIEAIQDYEPRVKVVKVTYLKDHRLGKLQPKVQVMINDTE